MASYHSIQVAPARKIRLSRRNLSTEPPSPSSHDPLAPLATLSLSRVPSSANLVPHLTSSSQPDSISSLRPFNPPASAVDTPIFGTLAYPQLAQYHTTTSNVVDDDSMEWEIIDPSVAESEIVWGPQRFFPPHQPTGLEELFDERMRVDDEVEGSLVKGTATQTLRDFVRDWFSSSSWGASS